LQHTGFLIYYIKCSLEIKNISFLGLILFFIGEHAIRKRPHPYYDYHEIFIVYYTIYYFYLMLEKRQKFCNTIYFKSLRSHFVFISKLWENISFFTVYTFSLWMEMNLIDSRHYHFSSTLTYSFYPHSRLSECQLINQQALLNC
jgi:hypothetical protein